MSTWHLFRKLEPLIPAIVTQYCHLLMSIEPGELNLKCTFDLWVLEYNVLTLMLGNAMIMRIRVFHAWKIFFCLVYFQIEVSILLIWAVPCYLLRCMIIDCLINFLLPTGQSILLLEKSDVCLYSNGYSRPIS